VIAGDDLVVHLARFAGSLRSRGIAVSIIDEIDATRAMTLVDVADREELRRALIATLKIRPRDRAVFDDEFAEYWSAATPPGGVQRVATPPGGVLGRRAAGTRAVGLGQEVQETIVGDTPGYSAEVALRRKPFEDCTARDLADMEQLLLRWTPRWAARRSRRLTPVKGRGITDIRRSFRKALATGGELLTLARRGRAIDEPRLVVLCDTSGSMDAHVPFVLAFALALKRVAARTEVFAFNTSLTRLTPWLSPSKIQTTLERLASGVPDWSGGTRIGESLSEFVAKYGDELIDAKTIVVIVSDGLDRGDSTLVADAMRTLSAKARRIVWLNPLSGDPRYEPTARAMQIALPFIDRFGSAHNLESLERLLPELAA
jgi:uncharacterized protein with von Willebrand factor type A (vWA) domain